MKKHKEGKDFLHLPTYPGGKDAFRAFIRDNLKYPPEALKNKVQGKVYLSYEVSDNGDVISVQVTKSLGYGCDEEALRLVRMLKYDKVKNRGLRLKSNVKTYIEFKLTEIKQSVSYQYVTEKKKEPEEKPVKGPVHYGYTIKF